MTLAQFVFVLYVSWLPSVNDPLVLEVGASVRRVTPESEPVGGGTIEPYDKSATLRLTLDEIKEKYYRI